MESASLQAHILIVDDDPGNQEALRGLLEGPASKVILAHSGSEALRQILRRDFAAILMDVRMPVMDGFETARLIREREKSRRTPIIFLTGAFEDLPSVFRGYEAGAVDYIIKPVVPEVLKSKIAVFVDLYNTTAALTREIAERMTAETKLRASEEELRALAARLQSVREEEWTRISREIHDELGQALTSLKMDLNWIAKHLAPGEQALEARTKAMSSLIDSTVDSVRKIAARLRPEVLDELGLGAAIEWQAREFQRRAGIRCGVSLPSDALVLDRERSTAMFRIFQELLTNVARHANATKVDVLMRSEPHALVLRVEDNGRGINAAAVSSTGSLGFLGIRERILPFGGSLQVDGSPGKGTEVEVWIPLGLS
jgi:signal transduction histidine kinase